MSKLEKIKEIILEELESYLTKHTLGVEEKHRLLINLKLATEIMYYIEGSPKIINYQSGPALPYYKEVADKEIISPHITCKSSTDDNWWPK